MILSFWAVLTFIVIMISSIFLHFHGFTPYVYYLTVHLEDIFRTDTHIINALKGAVSWVTTSAVAKLSPVHCPAKFVTNGDVELRSESAKQRFHCYVVTLMSVDLTLDTQGRECSFNILYANVIF